MGRITDDMSRLADEIEAMKQSRGCFIKEIQDVVKQEADETRQFIRDFKNEMNDAHEAFFRKKASHKG